MMVKNFCLWVMAALLVLMMLSGIANAQGGRPVLGYEVLYHNAAATSGASSFTVPADTYLAMITFEGGDPSFRLDGTDATPQNGHILDLDMNKVIQIDQYSLAGFSFCPASGESGVTARVTFFGKDRN